MNLDGATIAIIVSHEFEDIEMEYPILALSHLGAEVKLVPMDVGFNARASSDEPPVRGRFGTPAPPIVLGEGTHFEVEAFDSLAVGDLDCLLFPGGFSPDHLRTVDEVVEFTREAYEAGVVVAAICHGPWMLVEADLCDGRDVCGYDAIHTDLANAGANVVDAHAVRDGRIVTGYCPDSLPEFCEVVAETIVDREEVSEAIADD